MVNLTKLTKAELQSTGFKNVSIARNFLKDILKTKAQKFNKTDLIKKLSSEFNKFTNFGINLNDAHKISKKAELATKKEKKAVKDGDQALYDMTKAERDKLRKELKDKLLEERNKRKKDRAATKLLNSQKKTLLEK